jgi:hypothetical protein
VWKKVELGDGMLSHGSCKDVLSWPSLLRVGLVVSTAFLKGD